MKYRGQVFLVMGLCFILTGTLRAQAAKKKEDQKKVLKEGKLLYEKYSCKSCHGDKGIQQGNLTRAFEKYSDEQMKAYIKDPHKFNNYKMPVYEQVIPEKAYQPLIEYIRHLGKNAAGTK